MPKLYCPHCAKPYTYTLTKPSECPSCDKPFASAFKGATPVTKRYDITSVPTHIPAEYNDVEENDETKYSDIEIRASVRPRISSDAFTVSNSANSFRGKLGDFIKPNKQAQE